jgi:4-amino-4-deoxy-L-arabinose transferase-like glycosyltransferase
LTESVFTMLFVLGVLLSIKSHVLRKLCYLAASAVVLGLAVLCRPVALFFPAVLFVRYLVAERARWQLRIGRS